MRQVHRRVHQDAMGGCAGYLNLPIVVEGIPLPIRHEQWDMARRRHGGINTQLPEQKDRIPGRNGASRRTRLARRVKQERFEPDDTADRLKWVRP
jgi:hypothetical protein